MQFHKKKIFDLFDFTSFLPGLVKIFWPAVLSGANNSDFLLENFSLIQFSKYVKYFIAFLYRLNNCDGEWTTCYGWIISVIFFYSHLVLNPDFSSPIYGWFFWFLNNSERARDFFEIEDRNQTCF